MGLMDKIKGMFGSKPASGGTGSGTSTIDSAKQQAGEVKDTVDDLVDKHEGKVPDNVAATYDNVSDKVEDVIPGNKDSEAGEVTGG